MNYTIYFSICSLFYSILLLNVVKNSKLPKTNNNKAFKVLLNINLITIISDIVYNFIAVSQKQITLPLLIMSRIFLICLLAWIISFTLYVYATLFNEKDKSKDEIERYKKKVIIVAITSLIISSVVVIILPVHHNLKEIYSYGPAINFVNYFSDACLIIGIIYMFKNYNKLNGQKCAPFFAFIVGGVLMAILQSYDPKLLLIVAVETFITYMVYFTLDKENKDAIINNKYIYDKQEVVEKLEKEKK